MQLHPRLRDFHQRWVASIEPLNGLQLKCMPLWYLISMSALPGLGVTFGAPEMHKATQIYVHELLPVAPWSVSAVIGLLLLCWWALVGLLTVMTTAHGRALGERLFNFPAAGA